MATPKTHDRIRDLMEMRQAVIELLANRPNSQFTTDYRQRLTAEQEQVVATYVHALVVDEVSSAISNLGAV